MTCNMSSVALHWVPAREEEDIQVRPGEDLQEEMRVSWSGIRRVATDRGWWKSLIIQCSSRSGRI